MTRTHRNKYKIEVKFSEQFPESALYVSIAGQAYIADLTLRTFNARGVEFVENIIPTSPTGDEPMDVFSISNPDLITYCFGVFSDSSFKDANGDTIKHTEGFFFPSLGNDDCWVAFLEIKDCKPKNAANYNKDMKQKVIESKTELLNRGVITKKNRCYGIASYPRRKLEFNDMIFNDEFEQKSLFKSTGILFMATNAVIINRDRIIPVFD